MRRRMLRWALALAVLVVMTAGVVTLWPRTDRITRENFDRIQKGMSRAENEAILGPPGNYATDPTKVERDSDEQTIPLPCDVQIVSWTTDTDSCTVVLGPSGQVVAMAHSHWARTELSPLDNLLLRAKRQWHRWFP